MLRGIVDASSGMLTDERLMQTLSNNLANSQTPGFTASNGIAMSFPDQLIQSMNANGSSGGTIGTLGTGVVFQQGVPYFSQGTIQNTGRSLDVAIRDNTPVGTYASVVKNGQVMSQGGSVTTGNGGRIEVNGIPLVVLNGQNQPVQGIYAVRNIKYQGSALYGPGGSPVYDAQGNPSYVFENQAGQVVSVPSPNTTQSMSVRVGNENDMGIHSFFPVSYKSFNGTAGLALTRDGSFSINANHQLVDVNGHAVLPVGTNGLPIANGRIVINPNYQGTNLFGSNGQPLTDGNGQVSYKVVGPNGQPIAGAKLGAVGADVTTLSPLGQTEYMVNNSLSSNAVSASLTPSSATLLPGELEGSNVNTTSTMTQMAIILQEYQANQNVLQAEGQVYNVASTNIGKVNI